MVREEYSKTLSVSLAIPCNDATVSIKAVIWKNPGSNGNGPLLNTTLARLYKDPESDTWKESQSLGRDDLLLAAKVLGEAHTWIYCRADEQKR